MARGGSQRVETNRALDQVLLGDEPTFDSPITSESDAGLCRAFRWYGQARTPEELLDLIVEWLPTVGLADLVEGLRATPLWAVPSSVGAVAGMRLRGIELPESVVRRAMERVRSVVSRSGTIDHSTIVGDVPTRRPTRDVVAEFEQLVDDHVRSDHSTPPPGTATLLTTGGWTQRDARRLVEYYEPLLDELLEASSHAVDRDPQVVEAYSRLSRKRLAAYVAFVRDLVEGARTFLAEAGRKRRPRRARKVPASKVVARLKYMRASPELGIESVHPESVVGAEELWTFNVRYRRLTRFVAAGPEGLSVSGTTVLNYDENASTSKVIRKPETVVGEVARSGRVTLRRIMDGIKTKASSPNGRINSDTLLLRAVR